MGPLGKHLAASTLPVHCQESLHLPGWQEFLAKVQLMDLESALTGVNVTPEVLGHVVHTTCGHFPGETSSSSLVAAPRSKWPTT